MLLGSLSLGTKKPWAIAPEYFTPVKRVLYLRDMAVAPAAQGRAWAASSLARPSARPGLAGRCNSTDASDGAVGAGAFYAKYGFKEVGRVVYRGTPLIYFELLLT